MADKVFPQSQVPIRKTVDLLPQVFRTSVNEKFLAGTMDAMVQPGVLEKTVGYIGRRYGKTYKGTDVYLDTDQTLRSRYQLEPGVVVKDENNKIKKFYDYIDFKNQLKFFGNLEENDKNTTNQEHYTWNPPIDWDKFVNFREYYWVPEGPPAVFVSGQAQNITSTYRVKLGTNNEWILTPDGYTPNPTVTLYRGQTYKFQVTAPGNGFFIRSVYDVGTLTYNPLISYSKGQLALFDGKLWRAKVNISASDGSTIDESSQDWEFVEAAAQTTALDYNQGVTNNGTEKGTITFTVPLDAPDVLFYQSATDPNALGRFIVGDVESNTKIDILKEVIGKKTYTSSNGIVFTNGLAVRFTGQVIPEAYSDSVFIVEGVGNAIKLIKYDDLVVSSELNSEAPEILFDNGGFDADPFDDASAYPANKDYITINRSSPDNNPWSRYNRWFHKSVLEYAHRLNDSSFDSEETARAKRPILEFNSGLQLYNHGSIAKTTVDYIDDFTTDVFSTVEGSLGYNVDNEQIFDGARILITADTDSLVKNKIYEVYFINHNGRRQISLKETEDSVSQKGQCVLIRRGEKNKGLMYHFDGESWISSQKKISVNQAPLFDIFDSNEISFSDVDTYPVSTFTGSKVVSYKIGTGSIDSELGFAITYQNIDNVGDIEFNFDFDTEFFRYQIQQEIFSKNTNTGFLKLNETASYTNCWSEIDQTYLMPIIDSAVVGENLTELVFETIDWNTLNSYEIYLYLNGDPYTGSYSRNGTIFTFEPQLKTGDVITIKVFGDVVPDKGYYEFPAGIERNPLNDKLETFTLGTVQDHVKSAIEFDDEFSGNYPGDSNLRDINDFRNKARRFVKHSGISSIALALLCDKDVNVIKALQFAKKSYTDFKNNFIKIAEKLQIDASIPDFVDAILSEISKTKTESSVWSGSDMVGTGAYTDIDYVVEDTGIKTFALSQKFDLNELSDRAVYVYLNNRQLLVNKEYSLDSTFGFVRLEIDLTEGDRIQIREYSSTAFSFIPPTPTKYGLYKKYTPMIFLDDTYVNPRTVIQGHDGSITTAYNDYRDELILELEYRIYNNIKQEYDESVSDIDSVIGGYYGVGLYNKPQLDQIVIREFLKWIADTNIDYKTNNFLDTENSFTFTYSNMADPTGTVNLPGYWRGVYRWFYDTDRPHTCPWEILGFSEKPTWWEEEYGPAPYTRNNLILWEDIRDGIIRQGEKAGTHQRYARPSILSHIPVDADGKLLSPLDSGLATNYSLVNNRGPFKLGDVAPAEAAWRMSSEWPFAVSIAMCLLKPFEFITRNLDRSRSSVNLIDQQVNKETGVFFTKADIEFPQVGSVLTSGLVNFVVDYLKSKNLTYTDLQNLISGIDLQLSSRISGFVDQNQQKYILDSKNPRSTSGNVFVPPENYDVVFNVSAPISSVSYSGVLIEKTDRGWKIDGYDDLDPYFNYYPAAQSQSDPVMTVGGVSEKFVDWTTEKFYGNGVVVRYQNNYYRSVKSHDSGTNFDSSLWKKLPELPITGGVTAFNRRQFNTLSPRQLSYGTVLASVQEVVDFLLGYEFYLRSKGMMFNGYDPETQTAKDFTTACKEFMFWTKHNWSVGSLISLSPCADKVEISNAVGVADNLLDNFYDYQVKKSNGQPLPLQNINVTRDFQKVIIERSDTNEGIYFTRIYFVLKEHVVLFSNKTVFNDVIYDKPTGYRQERIKSRGFRTTDWDGDYTSPGFIFDNVNIEAWQPFVDYRLGDIVSYKSYNWVSLINQEGTETFNTDNWSKLDSNPTKGLIANFDYRINQFEDYFDLDADGVGTSQKELGRHFIGFQTRDYLSNLAEDEVTQFKLFQGFIREKGTANSVNKVFDKISQTDNSIVLNEEWAFRVGRFGGLNQLREIEFRIYKDDLKINPQPLIIQQAVYTGTALDRYVRIDSSRFTVKENPFNKDISPVTLDEVDSRDAGYTNLNQVDHIVKNRDDILSLDISQVLDNDHVWVTFDGPSWTVLRFTEVPLLTIENAVKDGTVVTLSFGRTHTFAEGDIVGIKDLVNLTGFYKVISVDNRSIDIEVSADASDPELDSTLSRISTFVEARVADYDLLDPKETALLKSGSKLYIDKNKDNLWEVVEKTKQYQGKSLSDYGITEPLNAGKKVLYIDGLKQIISSIPGSGYVMSYVETSTGLGLRQIISPPAEFISGLRNSFGESLAVSPDNKYLFVGTPLATGIRTYYKGPFQPNAEYKQGDIVLENGRLWKAKDNFRADGSSIDVYSENWELATIVEANLAADNPGFFEAGMVTIYEWADQQWNLRSTIMSPRADNGEKFGHDIAVSKSGNTYYAAISAVGSDNGRGRVYLYTGTSGVWSHLENVNYVGIHNTELTGYAAGSIVWWDGSLWQAKEDIVSDGSTVPSIDSAYWIKLDPVSTSCSLPQNPYVDDDGSTLASGLLSDDEIRELTKAGDSFGQALAMNRDGSILVVGVPNSDDEYFANYKGAWLPDQEYKENDVVSHDGGYFKLVNPELDADSTIVYTSTGDDPSSDPWVSVGDSISTPSGKVFIYQRDQFNRYTLKQTISASSMEIFSDIEESLSSGDLFGYSVDIDSTGNTIVATSPQADINGQNQGSVYVFKTDGFAQVEYRLKQKLESFEDQPNEFFGSSVSISAGTERIVVGAKNAPHSIVTTFDGAETTFDERKTNYKEKIGYTGQVYVFERKDQGYLLAEKLETDLTLFESFGFSVDCSATYIIVGSPDYKVDNVKKGMVRLFKRDNKDSFEIISQQTPSIDLEKIKSIELYDDILNVKLADLDFLDHRKLKILGSAEQEIRFKVPYDPAIYNVGTDSQVVDQSQTWYEKNVGYLWWDLSTVKWIDYEQSDISYKSGNWNRLAEGASVDIYEWVETPLLPSEWAALADTVDGLSQGISGQPLYPNDDVYSVKQLFSSATGLPTGTLYYYWVKNKNIIPSVPGRRITARDVYLQILNPISTGIPFLAFLDKDLILGYNLDSAIVSDSALVNIQYYKDNRYTNLIHNEYQLLTEGVADSLPSEKLESKWIDSLVGYDPSGNIVPDPALLSKQKYGIEFRPRQSMFVDRIKALQITIDRINSILETRPFAENLSSASLFSKDEQPNDQLNQYDIAVDTYLDLEQVGTVRIRQAILSANIVDGRVDTIDIIDPGFGYRKVPPVVIQGDGAGATAIATIDNQGRVSSVSVINKGRKYSSVTATVRPFSVLVQYDETSDNFWTVYAWDQQRKIFYRSKSQGYDVTRYWDYKDWWKEGFNPSSRIIKEIPSFYLENTITVSPGDLIKIKEYGNGGWAVLEVTELGIGDLLGKYNLVGRERGTIYIKDTVYNPKSSPIGFDFAGSYDAGLYDLQPTKELRLIFDAVKEDLFLDDLRVEWNNLFFAGVRYAFSEQLYVDWAFKTSFLNAIHNVGDLQKKVTYKNDNLDSFKNYLEEVKPYRTTIREYTSRYTELQPTGTSVTDFDLPPVYSSQEGKIVPVNTNNETINEYPWKWWLDNQGYSIVSIEIADGGEGYTSIPTVLIEGNGTGAKAEAFINNGRVSGIKVINAGTGYTVEPTISLVGGNGFNNRIARAVPILGEGKARTFNISLKFDRISKQGIYNSLTKSETIVAPGKTSTFDLSYASTIDKTKIRITINNLPILSSDYSIRMFKSTTDTYSLIKSRLVFEEAPSSGDVIVINYEKNDQLLDSVNRIEKYYNPSSGMKGKQLNQLMTGIDFGGVQIQATTFDVTGGWDALPWFTDGWDAVENNTDFYVVVDGSTTFVQLPTVPAEDELITVYLKRAGEEAATRIDDLYYLNYDGSTVQPNGRTAAPETALMPTFVGDGSTNQIEIGDYVRTFPGDTLIFRSIYSDGSVEIKDVNIIDTKISGGSLENIGGAYTTANGLSAEDITIDGGKFISPEHVPATEENVPGQVLDSVSIRVYTSPINGATPLQTKIYPADGVTSRFKIGLTVTESQSVLVYVDKVKQEYSGNSVDYTLDFINNEIEFVTAPAAGKVIEIISIGIGGIGILDYQEFVADGTTNLFLCRASYSDTQTVFVTLDGEFIDTGYSNSSDYLDTTNRVLVQFGQIPTAGQVIKIVCLGAGLDTDSSGQSIIRINQQTIIYDGSTRSYDLDRFVNLSRGSSVSSVLVNLNGHQLNNVDTTYQIYDGTNNTVIVGVDPEEAVGTITSGNIKVYINGELARFVIDYTFDGNQNLININSSLLSVGDVIKVETDIRSEYFIDGNNITFSPELTLVEDDVIEVTWFGEYPTLNLISDQYTGGQVKYKLSRQILDVSFVWVYKNGERLTQDFDYYVDANRSNVYLTANSTQDDLIKIIQFSGETMVLPSAYEIHKDMLNVYHYKRYSEDAVSLDRDLYYYDQEILVTDASNLAEPIRSRNVPGIVYINGERIEYLIKEGNVLKQLRRGTLGTAIAEVHESGSAVIDSSYTENLPYNEVQEKYEFVSDGSTLLIGPLEFTPPVSSRDSWTRISIPEEYGPCDTLEVFVGGRRLRKDPISVYDEEISASSPSADVTLEAEFSVNGSSSFIRLTDAVPIGTKITIIRKTGQTWYERGENSITSGKTILRNDTAIARFITAKTTKLPE